MRVRSGHRALERMKGCGEFKVPNTHEELEPFKVDCLAADMEAFPGRVTVSSCNLGCGFSALELAFQGCWDIESQYVCNILSQYNLDLEGIIAGFRALKWKTNRFHSPGKQRGSRSLFPPVLALRVLQRSRFQPLARITIWVETSISKLLLSFIWIPRL